MAILWQAGTLPGKPAEKIGSIKLAHHSRDEAGAAQGGHCWGTSTVAGAFRRCHQGWPCSIRMQAQPWLSVLACGDLGPSSFLTCSERLLPLPRGLSGTFCTMGGQLTVVVAPKECDSSVVVLTPACITSYKGVCVASPVQRSVRRMLFGLQNIG